MSPEGLVGCSRHILSPVIGKMPLLPLLPKAFPMEYFIWALFRASPWRIGLGWVAERQDRQEVQVRRNTQEFLDLVSLQTADPTGAYPFIPASQLHILHRPCSIDLMPTVCRIRHHGDRKACLLDKPPRGAQGSQALQQGLIADHDQMPRLPVPRARG